MVTTGLECLFDLCSEEFMRLACKCGNTQIEWDSSISSLLARRCGCDYCTEQDCAYVGDPSSTISYKILDPVLCRIVQHGTETASFYECVHCGLVFVTSEIEGVLYGVLNAKALGVKGYKVDGEIKTFSNESIAIILPVVKVNGVRWLSQFSCVILNAILTLIKPL